MKGFKKRLWFFKGPDKEEWECLNPMKLNPFKNWKTAIKYLAMDMHNKTQLSNYEPSEIDWALFTLFRSKRFMQRIK